MPNFHQSPNDVMIFLKIGNDFLKTGFERKTSKGQVSVVTKLVSSLKAAPEEEHLRMTHWGVLWGPGKCTSIIMTHLRN